MPVAWFQSRPLGDTGIEPACPREKYDAADQIYLGTIYKNPDTTKERENRWYILQICANARASPLS